jgi:hypothetical protein
MRLWPKELQDRYAEYKAMMKEAERANSAHHRLKNSSPSDHYNLARLTIVMWKRALKYVLFEIIST